MNDQLTHITALIKARQYDEARPLLQVYLDAHPDEAYAWYLQSFADSSPNKRLKAVQRAVKLAPDEPKFQKRLSQLGGTKRGISPILLGLGALLTVLIIAVTGVLFAQRGSSAVSALPTAADLASVTPSSTATASPSATATVTHLSPTASFTFTPSATSSPAPSATITETQSATVIPTSVAATAEIAAPDTVQASTLPAGVVPIPTALDGSITISPVTGETPNSGVPTAEIPATFVPGSTIPLGNAVTINGGSLRVLSATRPASQFIQDLGGSASAPPSGQEWMLVELLVICSTTTNCTPDISNFRLTNAAGGEYAYSAIDLGASFSSAAYAAGQTWGYLSFQVPRSQTQLTLVLSTGSQEYRFALA